MAFGAPLTGEKGAKGRLSPFPPAPTFGSRRTLRAKLNQVGQMRAWGTEVVPSPVPNCYQTKEASLPFIYLFILRREMRLRVSIINIFPGLPSGGDEGAGQASVCLAYVLEPLPSSGFLSSPWLGSQDLSQTFTYFSALPLTAQPRGPSVPGRFLLL